MWKVPEMVGSSRAAPQLGVPESISARRLCHPRQMGFPKAPEAGERALGSLL